MRIRLFDGIVICIALLTSMLAQAGDYVYVANSYVHGTNPTWATVAKLSAADVELVDTLTVCNNAHTLALTPDRSRLWVTCPPINNIIIINTITFKKVRTIDLGDIIINSPMGVAITPDGTTAYVTYANTGQLGIWTANEGAYVDTVTIGGSPNFIVFTPDGSKAYVSDYSNSTIKVMDISDNSVLKTIDFAGPVLQDAVVSPDGSHVYVSNMEMDRIEVISTSDDTVFDPIATDYIHPRGINISPDGQYLFVGHYLAVDALVTMLRISDENVVATADIPSNPRVIAINKRGTRIYVTEHNSDEVYAYNVSGETLTYAASEDLNTVPGYYASPVGIVLSEDPFPWHAFLPAIHTSSIDE